LIVPIKCSSLHLSPFPPLALPPLHLRSSFESPAPLNELKPAGLPFSPRLPLRYASGICVLSCAVSNASSLRCLSSRPSSWFCQISQGFKPREPVSPAASYTIKSYSQTIIPPFAVYETWYTSSLHHIPLTLRSFSSTGFLSSMARISHST
jgi:hypothetical protein